MDQYTIPKEISSEMKFSRKFYLFDIVILISSLSIGWLFSSMVYTKIIFFYYIFIFFGTVFLLMRNKFNPKKRNFQTVYFALKRDRTVYTRI
ncbi:hypothetical protein FDB15_18305 [Clostridium botulinum]|uniref:DUF5592 family protein n=1 Tax=Clostridium TaxID=1485 RepID=UPI00077488B5|nr:DUF5592 family protein [Clostridium botulinum]NFI02376.1 hypothetical protein [Clostridium botulinum]NFI64778.1 hypothetical protein [Clostridium botulinum]NFJ45632.1 hypothetical protein [Clostridium botulinum]NFJ49241.1 hypothetical protein [Clostridium botulinum]NFK26939.1 hypothetical protein [Clostridium botulinum]